MLTIELLGEKINPNVHFKYHEDSEGDDNRGWQVDKITAFIDDTEVGYLKLAYIPRKRFEKWYPSILNYVDQIVGTHILPHEYRGMLWTQIPTDVLRKSVYNLAQVAGLGWTESNELADTAKTASDAELHQIYRKLIVDLKKTKGVLFKRFERYFVDHPYVDFIRVNDNYQRQGIGTALYRAGHEWMKAKDMKLHASTTQTDYAKAAWKSLERDYNVEKIRVGIPSS